jgi:hypothetical protein
MVTDIREEPIQIMHSIQKVGNNDRRAWNGVVSQRAIIAAPAAAERRIAAIPPAGLLRPRREERAALDGVGNVLADAEVLEDESEELTIFEVTPVVGMVGVVIGVPVAPVDEPVALVKGVDDEDGTTAVAAPIEKLEVLAKTSLMSPMLTACKV